jgi:hypothetical protein
MICRCDFPMPCPPTNQSVRSEQVQDRNCGLMCECWCQYSWHLRMLEERKKVSIELQKGSQRAVCCVSHLDSCGLSLPLTPYSSSQSQSSYIIRNPQQRRISQSQPVRGRDEEQDDIVSADVEEVLLTVLSAGDKLWWEEQSLRSQS